MKFSSTILRKWMRVIHRDLSYIFSGVLVIYAVSGIVMNHRDTINPNFSVERKEYVITEALPAQKDFTRNDVIKLLEPLGETKNLTKHYFPKAGQMKVFLKGGSNLIVDINTGKAVYESVTRKPIISAMTKLHYNPGKWWTWFSDAFAVGLIIITLTGIFMLKGKKGIVGRGGIELIAGILIPLIFLFFF